MWATSLRDGCVTRPFYAAEILLNAIGNTVTSQLGGMMTRCFSCLACVSSTLLLWYRLDIPESFIFFPHFPATGSRAEQTGLYRCQLSCCLSFPLKHFYAQRHQLLLRDIPRLRCIYLHYRESFWGRGFPETSQGEAKTLQLISISPVLPFSPNVPDMDGCSPVNFLGVFCFLPDSKERNRERDLVK